MEFPDLVESIKKIWIFFLFRIIPAIIVFLFFCLIGKVLQGVTSYFSKTSLRKKTYGWIVRIFIKILGLYIAFRIAGIDFGFILTIIAAFVFAFVYILLDPLKNIAAGLINEYTKHIKKGDYIRIDKNTGIVHKLDAQFVTIQLKNQKETFVDVPNNFIFSKIHKLSKNPISSSLQYNKKKLNENSNNICEDDFMQSSQRLFEIE